MQKNKTGQLWYPIRQRTVTKNENTKQLKPSPVQMHPEVISDKPGKCPNGGMELIERITY